MTDPIVCQLCGHSDKRDLGTSLAHWRDAPAGMGYEHVVRCRDAEACRARVQAAGAVWPLVVEASDHRMAG